MKKKFTVGRLKALARLSDAKVIGHTLNKDVQSLIELGLARYLWAQDTSVIALTALGDTVLKRAAKAVQTELDVEEGRHEEEST